MKDFFKIKKHTTFEEMVNDVNNGKNLKIPTSDLCLQTESGIIQFEFVRERTKIKKEKIKPGVYNIVSTQHGPALMPFDLQSVNILEEVVNTKEIKENIDDFFNNLHIYKELNEPAIRRILLWSDPGLGKTSTILDYCKKAVEADKKTVVINWPTNSIKSSSVVSLFNDCIDLSKCSKLILIIEDLAGTGVETPTKVIDQDLLELLQGIRNPFTIPTVVLATTNYPYKLVKALHRPGRIDKPIELKPPSASDMCKIIEFMTKKKLTEEEINAISSDTAKGFSIAHIKEALIRSKIQKKPLLETIKELAEYSKKVDKGFEKESKSGFGF